MMSLYPMKRLSDTIIDVLIRYQHQCSSYEKNNTTTNHVKASSIKLRPLFIIKIFALPKIYFIYIFKNNYNYTNIFLPRSLKQKLPL